MLEVKSPGLFTTIQDEGRFGYSSKGVPTSGAMDKSSYRLANHLLDNDIRTPVFEFTQVGPTLFFHARSRVVITGGTYEVRLNGKVVPHQQPFSIDPGSELKVGKLIAGNYGYLAISGGFSAKRVLGSFSYCPNLNEEAKCIKGMKFLFIRSSQEYPDLNAKVTKRSVKPLNVIDVDEGPEFHLLNKNHQRMLFEAHFKTSKSSSRMAIQLDHQLEVSLPDILTVPVQPGTVQLTPAGNLIVLMRDAQTTGGYARILQLSEKSIDLLSQLKPTNELRFSCDQKATFNLI